MSRPIVVLCPHFAPDTAPTGEVITRIVEEFVAAGQRVHVVTSLPWYRAHEIEDGWTGRLVRRERTAWGSIIRVHPFPGKSKSNLARRALVFERLTRQVVVVRIDWLAHQPFAYATGGAGALGRVGDLARLATHLRRHLGQAFATLLQLALRYGCGELHAVFDCSGLAARSD